MKKTLLLLAVALLSSAAAFAQWTKPTLTTPDIQGQALVKDGTTEQYLYNVEKKAFFLGANDWTTRASVCDTLGYKVKVTYQEPTESYTITDWCHTNGKEDWAWRDMFVVNQQEIWVDNSTGANHDLWQFEEVEGINFKIYNDGLGKTSELQEGNGYGYLSAPLDINDTRLYLTSWFLADETRGAAGSTWMSVTPEAYEAYITTLKETYAVYGAELARYNAAMALKAYLDKAKEEGNGADLSAEWAIYNDNTSTLEQLQAALESATQKCVDWSASQANVENPQDVSDMIENSTFDVIGDFHGWKGTAFAAGGTTSTCAEHYEKNYDTYQEVNGGKDIPNGVYKVGVVAFYRAGSIANDWNTRDNASVRNAKLYTVSGADSLMLGLPSLATWAIESSELGGTTVGDAAPGMYVPNTMADFTAWKEAGKGHVVETLIPVLNGKLKIGVRKDVLIGTDWTIVDDFKLTYYGAGLDAYDLWRTDVINKILADMQGYDWENIYYERAARAEFEATLAAARAATTAEDIHAQTVALTQIVQKVLGSIATYTELADKWTMWKEAIEEYSGDLVQEFLEREEEVMNVLENGELTTEQVRALINELAAQYEYAVKHSLQEGDDCTNMITNASFADGLTGWTGEGTVTNNFFPNVERYDNTVEISQTLTDVPAGLYSVSVKAFERPAANGSFTGEEESKVFLYMGSLETPVQNIVKDAMPEEEAEDKVNCYKGDETGAWPYDYNVEGYGWVPNSVDGASYAFQAGRYVQKVYGLVGDDGVMKIGLTSHGVKAHWVLWADFRLTFEGKNVDGLREAIAPTVEGIEEYVNSRLDQMSTVGADYASEKADEIMETYENADDYDQLVALVEEITKLKDYIAKNIKMVEEFIAAYTALEEALAEYGDTAPEDLVDEASAMCDDYVEFWYNEVSDEEIIAATKAINEMVAKLRIPAYEGASDENPVDMTQVIVNPTFDEGNYNGWTLVKREGASGNYQTQNGFDGTKAMEFWSNSNGSATKFDFYQDIIYLPAGTYELTADAANSLNGQSAGPGEGAVYLYAGTGTDAENMSVLYNKPVEVQEAACNGDGAQYANYSVIFKVEEGKIVRVGFQNIGELSARWAMVDNFQLLYFGAESSKEPNAIDVVESVVAPVAIYDLAGRRVVKAVKGIYIINGKKVVK